MWRNNIVTLNMILLLLKYNCLWVTNFCVFFVNLALHEIWFSTKWKFSIHLYDWVVKSTNLRVYKLTFILKPQKFVITNKITFTVYVSSTLECWLIMSFNFFILEVRKNLTLLKYSRLRNLRTSGKICMSCTLTSVRFSMSQKTKLSLAEIEWSLAVIVLLWILCTDLWWLSVLNVFFFYTSI